MNHDHLQRLQIEYDTDYSESLSSFGLNNFLDSKRGIGYVPDKKLFWIFGLNNFSDSKRGIRYVPNKTLK